MTSKIIFRESGTNKVKIYKKRFNCVYTNGNGNGIQYFSSTTNEIVLLPGFRPRMIHGYVDIVKLEGD